MIGKTLAHYEVVDRIGKGGMGEVYRAKDVKLGRNVAIKVLPDEFALDKDRVARFQREAKFLAALNHPNIAAIYGLEEADGINFLVMELIEGDTLADRIKAGPLPVEEALKLALQIAEALETAHEKGVIHRDLKPANIKVAPEGMIKVLDFGLAKAFSEDPENENPRDSPTLSDAATRKGVLLGTSAYMPPEQAKGKTVDKRADIWAFGVVLFEMLSGQQLFTGETVSETLASVLKSDPEWQRLPQNLHPRIRMLLERCLEKDPRDRLGSISDARVDIRKVIADPEGSLLQSGVTVAPQAKRRTMLPWTAATVILIIIAAVISWNMRTPQPRMVMRFIHELPEGVQFSMEGLPNEPFIAVSPDGDRIAYGTNEGIFIRSVDELEAKLIPRSDKNPRFLFFSPDGQWIGYGSSTDRKLKKIAVTGGSPVSLCDYGTVFTGAHWSTDDTIVFSVFPGGMMRVSANGGTPETILKSDITRDEGFPVMPRVLPDGKTILYTAVQGTTERNAKIMTLLPATGEVKQLSGVSGVGARYYSTGHILYLSGNNIYAVPFEPGKGELTGGEVPILEGVRTMSLSESGTLAYAPLAAAQGTGTTVASGPERTLWWVDRNGHEERIEAPPRHYQYPKISPDGKKIALTAEVDGNEDIWILDLVRGNLPRLTFNEGMDGIPLWSSDGLKIAYSSIHDNAITSGGITGIFCKAADGTGKPEFLGASAGKILLAYSWSSDMNTVLAVEMDTSLQQMNIGMLSTEGEQSYTPLLSEDYMETHPQLSPDGHWLAYCSGESGDGSGGQVYVRPFPDVDAGGRWQVSTHNGSSCPLWSPDGKELFYLVGGNVAKAVVSVPVETEPTFNPGKPKILFEGEYVGPVPTDGIPYDIHPDGKRFLMMKQPAGAAEDSAEAAPVVTERSRIVIVTNWFEEMKKKVTVEK